MNSVLTSDWMFVHLYTNISDPVLSPSSLHLLVPPLRLLSAAMWQVAQQRDVRHYEKLEEFVTLVTEAIPELLSHRHRAQLILGLRARVRHESGGIGLFGWMEIPEKRKWNILNRREFPMSRELGLFYTLCNCLQSYEWVLPTWVDWEMTMTWFLQLQVCTTVNTCFYCVWFSWFWSCAEALLTLKPSNLTWTECPLLLQDAQE